MPRPCPLDSVLALLITSSILCRWTRPRCTITRGEFMRASHLAVLVVATVHWGCAFMTVDRSPSYEAASRLPPGVPISCTNSNWAAGVDLVLATTAILIAASAAAEADDPATVSREDVDGDRASVVFLVVSALPAVSMLYGFQTTHTCRQVKGWRGEWPEGGNDWLIAPAVVVTLGVAMAAVRHGGSQQRPANNDLCLPGARPTAICNDGVVSCSLNRAGTCSWHGGVRQWNY
jgi:hypothetical protein